MRRWLGVTADVRREEGYSLVVRNTLAILIGNCEAQKRRLTLEGGAQFGQEGARTEVTLAHDSP